MTEKLLSVEDVAGFLGITKMGVYGLVFKKKIPALRISKRLLRFREEDIQAWLRTKAQSPEMQFVQPPIRKSPGRPRKAGSINNSYVDSLVSRAKKEALNV